MSIETVDYLLVKRLVESLGLDRAGGTDLALLPPGAFTVDDPARHVHSNDAATIRKILNEVGLNAIQGDVDGPRGETRIRKDAEWIGPLIVLGARFVTEHVGAIDIMFDAIKAYLVNYFGALSARSNVTLSVVVEDRKSGQYGLPLVS